MTPGATKESHQSVVELAKQIFDQHKNYKEASIQHRRFKHQDIVPFIEQLKQESLFEVKEVGKSVEQRAIYLIKAGTGKTKVMLWSQMHGDEPTATMALFDLFNFLRGNDELDALREQILQDLTLYIVPMLNPDGAERYQRRNALQIDLNRDALRLQSPEAQLLKNLRDELEPEFGFNLHDQSIYYAAGATDKAATISFLAPAFDHAQTIDTVRGRAMHTIVGLNDVLQQLIPGQVAKFSDEHEPRAFGDNIQKWGTSVILIESGGYRNDPEKQAIRQLNFAAILSALHLIAGDTYTSYALEDYFKIPENARHLYDLVVRNVRYSYHGQETLLDVGIMRNEIDSAAAPLGFYHHSSIEEIGDMSIFYGYEEINAEGLTLAPGRVYPQPFKDIGSLTTEKADELLREGYTTIRLEDLPKDLNSQDLPLNITGSSNTISHELHLETEANFVLQDASGKVRYAIVNGFVYDLAGKKPSLFHGLML